MKTCNYSKTRLIRAVTLSAAIFATSALQAQTAQAPPPADSSGMTHATKEFMQYAAQADLTEIAMANIAQTRAQNTAVKELAKMMRADPQQNYDLLQVMAQNHLVTLGSSPDEMNQQAIHRLEKASDATFDKEYTKAMLKDHVQSITRFDKSLADIDEPSVRQYVQTTLPTLRKHLQHSENAARAAGLDEGTISSILKALPSDELLRTVASNAN